MTRLLLLSLCFAGWSLDGGLVRGYTGSDDRFVKKYAMMKVYESCFGPEVVREVRQEMRAASAKCQERAPGWPGPGAPAGLDRLHSLHLHANSPVHHAPHRQQHKPAAAPHQQQQQVDSARLQQALLAVLNRQAQGGYSAYRPVSQPQSQPAASPPYSSAPGSAPGSGSGYSSSGLSELLAQYQASSGVAAAAPAVPAPAPGIYQAMPQVDPLQALQALQTLQQYQSRGSYYQQQQQQQQQQQPSFYQHGAFGNRYSRSSKATKAPKASGSRASRDLDVQGQLETLTTRMTGRVKNVTCVMQELGYLDSSLEPDFERIAARISRLPVPGELRRDMLDGVQFCRQFSQCIPDSRRDKFLLSGELLRPMFFFRCYKHKKLEACIMKDVRERYQQGSAVDDNVLLPNTRAMDLDKAVDGDVHQGDGLGEDHMAAAVYEFLYGGDNLDGDPFF